MHFVSGPLITRPTQADWKEFKSEQEKMIRGMEKLIEVARLKEINVGGKLNGTQGRSPKPMCQVEGWVEAGDRAPRLGLGSSWEQGLRDCDGDGA